MTRVKVELKKYWPKFVQNFSTYTRVYTVVKPLLFFGLLLIFNADIHFVIGS